MRTFLEFHAKQEAEAVYQKSLDRPYWKDLSKKFPGYNTGGDTDAAVKWLRQQITDDFKDNFSDGDWTLVHAALTPKIHAGIT